LTQHSDPDVRTSADRQEIAPGFDHGRWNRVHDTQLDIDVRDPDGHRIGSASVKRTPLADPSDSPTPVPLKLFTLRGWVPVDGSKHILVGEFDHYSFYNPSTSVSPFHPNISTDEADFNIFITPDRPFQRLLDDVVETMEEERAALQAWVDAHPQGTLHPSDVPFPVGDGTPASVRYPVSELHDRKRGRGYCIECEITPDEGYYDNFWFRTKKPYTSLLVGAKIGVYGPWVRDFAHGGRPEIHPCEVIWWRNGSFDDAGPQPHVRWTVVVLQDDSNRFDRQSDYDTFVARPWSMSPRRARITMSLQAPRGQHAEYSISISKGQRIFEHPGEETRSITRDYDGRRALTVTKRMSKPAQLKARLSELAPDPTDRNKLRCFLELDVQVGEGDRGKEGFAELSIEHWVPVQGATPPPRNPQSHPPPQPPPPPRRPPGTAEP
jgi:hypothetical protein